MSSSGFAKRFGFARTNTSGEPASNTKLSDLGTYDVKGGMHVRDGEEIAENVVGQITEVEANRKLALFRREHHYDPNMPDEAFEAIDETTAGHDAKGEAQLVGDIIESGLDYVATIK